MLLPNAIVNRTDDIKAHHFTSTDQSAERGLRKYDFEIAAIEFVQKMGIRPNLMGYSFLIKAILLSLESPHLLRSFSKGLYPKIADHYGTDVRAIERNIRMAIESAYDYDPERVQSLFYYKVNKPCVSEVISLAVESIRFGYRTSGFGEYGMADIRNFTE
jgi:two-component system response regulator (stage 0 sporulation protein A)